MAADRVHQLVAAADLRQQLRGLPAVLLRPLLEVHVVAADGTVLVDEMRTTAPNGFLGLWLPRGQELALTLTRDGASASTQVTTTADSATCLTTMQLTD